MGSGAERILATIEQYAETVLGTLGLELVEVQFRREGHGWVLRLFIDRESGVTLEDCTAVSREISTWLDVEELIDHAYHLEVSSPGLERPLKKRKDFERFAGRMARIKLRQPHEGQKVFVGVVDRIEGNAVILLIDDEPQGFEFENIAKARLVI